MQNNNRTVKKYSKNPNKVKSTSFWLNVLKIWCEENVPEELNLLLKTDYAEKKKKKEQPHANHNSYTC